MSENEYKDQRVNPWNWRISPTRIVDDLEEVTADVHEKLHSIKKSTMTENASIKKLRDERFTYLSERIAELELEREAPKYGALLQTIDTDENEGSPYTSFTVDETEQITSLDKQITTLEKEVWNKSMALAVVESKINDMMTVHEDMAGKHKIDVAHLTEDLHELDQTLLDMTNGLTSHKAILMCADALRQAGHRLESSYVVRLEAQYLNALRVIGLKENQVKQINYNASALSNALKKDSTILREESSEVELKLMNQLSMVHTQMTVTEANFQKELLAQKKRIDSLQHGLSRENTTAPFSSSTFHNFTRMNEDFQRKDFIGEKKSHGALRCACTFSESADQVSTSGSDNSNRSFSDLSR